MKGSLALCTASAALVLVAGSARAQAPAGVDLVFSTTGIQLGVPCEDFSLTPYFPFIAAGDTWLVQVYGEPLSPHFLLFGPPPTSYTAFPGVDNLLMIHAPVSVVAIGATGPPDPASFCGQGHTDYVFTVPGGPPGGADFAMQALAMSSTTGNWAFSRLQWLTYL